jgi:hypothetical protein
MNGYASAPAAYKESSILTAPPERLVVMLYDGAHRFLTQAAAAMRQDDLAHANDRLQRAEAIGRRDRRATAGHLPLLPPPPLRGAARAQRGQDRCRFASARGAPRVVGSDSGRVAHPYGELIELAEQEHGLIARRDYAGLVTLLATRESLMAELPETAPAEAHEAIGRLIELQMRNDAAMGEAARGLGVELQRLQNGRAQVRRYAPGGGTAGQRVSATA